MADLADILGFLDREGALEIGAAPAVWPVLEADAEVFELDWSRLFPRRITDRGQQDWENFGNDGWTLPDDLYGRIAGEISASPSNTGSAPGWDRCAWYQPIHFHGPAWGIFIYDECVVDAARVLYLLLRRPPLTAALTKALLRAGFATLFLHEQYHHKTESLGLRLHVVERHPRYVEYFRNVYLPASGSDDQIEEGLANADSYHRLSDYPYSEWLGKSLREATRSYLKASFALAPPGYRLAGNLTREVDFDALENKLKAQVQEARLAPLRSRVDEFGIATHLNQSMFSLRQNIWTIAAKGSAPLFPVRPGITAPLPRRDLEKYLRSEGYSEQKGRGRGSHRMYAKVGARSVVLPDSKDLSQVVLRNTAHALGLKNVNDLRTQLTS